MARLTRKQRRAEADFAIAIDFNPGSPDPARVFRSMGQLIDAFQRFDRELVRTIDVNIEPVMVLEDIQAGSVKTWVKTLLSNVDDAALSSGDWKKIVGAFLVQSKYRLLKHLDANPRLGGREGIRKLQSEIYAVAANTGVRRIPAYSEPAPAVIVRAATEIGNGIAILQPHDRASLQLTDGDVVPFNPGIDIPADQVEQAVVERALTNEEELILKVKKPDFLGDSQWEFVHDTVVNARVSDAEWLQRFRDHEVKLEPGSAVRALVRVDVEYGYNRELISRRFTIIKVHEVLPPASYDQGQLLS